MKKFISVVTSLIAGLGVLTTTAQPHGGMGGPPGPRFGGDMAKLFGDNTAFSANVEMQSTAGPGGSSMTVPGRIEYLDGKSRFEMDLTKAMGANIPPQAAEQMKKMGMDRMAAISRPDKQIMYTIYPGLNAYIENPLNDATSGGSVADYKADVTKLGEEKVDGHACIKNKVVITDKEGKTHASTVWNATDLNNFPVRIETADRGNNAVMLFKDVKLAKPAAADFEAPASMKKCANFMELMQSAHPMH